VSNIFIAVDVGQVHDPTAIAIAERAELRGEWDAAQWTWRKVIEVRLRMLERVPLGTPYPDVVRRVAELTRTPKLAEATTRLAVDATGVGRPLVDMFKEERLRPRLLPVIVTAGDRQTSVDGFYYVPKRDLITSLVLRFQQGTLRIPAGMPCGNQFMEELHAMQVRVTPSGREQFGAWRTGSHDDLVFAVAMLCWSMNEFRPDSTDRFWTNRREAEMAEVFKKVMKDEKTLGSRGQ
jgi:hypothetical protein